MRVYVDTNVWLNFFGGDKRRSKYLPLDEFAANIFSKVENGEFEIVISDHLLKQLEWFVESRRALDELLERLDKHTLLTRVMTEDKRLANARTEKGKTNSPPLEFENMLHYTIAERTKCHLFITDDQGLDFPGTVKIVASKDIC